MAAASIHSEPAARGTQPDEENKARRIAQHLIGTTATTKYRKNYDDFTKFIPLKFIKLLEFD